jgi:hypothetical protein
VPAAITVTQILHLGWGHKKETPTTNSGRNGIDFIVDARIPRLLFLHGRFV